MESQREGELKPDAANEEVISLPFGGAKITIDPNIPSDNEIENKFWEREDKYHLFGSTTREEFIGATPKRISGAIKTRYRKELTLYKQLFRLSKIIADQVEKDSGGYDELAYQHAYKILILFGRNNLKETIGNLINYIEGFDLTLPDNLIRDLFARFTLPANGQLVTLNLWREFINKHGPIAFKLFGLADRLEEKNAKMSGAPGITHLFPKSLEEANNIKVFLDYRRAGEAPELARLCSDYNLAERIFNRCLDIERRRKTKDNLPDFRKKGSEVNIPGGIEAPSEAVGAEVKQKERIEEAKNKLKVTLIKSLANVIDGLAKGGLAKAKAEAIGAVEKAESKIAVSQEAAETIKATTIESRAATTVPATTVAKAAAGYWLVKLPIDDPRALILGEITNCCQSIGKDSEECVIDGITRENSGFYVLLHGKKESTVSPLMDSGKINYDDYEIAGQGYAWLSEEGNLVFDSWENLRKEHDDPIIVEMLKSFAKEITDDPESHISRVMIGVGNYAHTTHYFYSLEKACNEQMLEGFPYPDSAEQKVVYESTRLTEKREKIQKLFPNYILPLGQIISLEQADRFLDFLKEGSNRELVNRFLELIIKQSEKHPVESLGNDASIILPNLSSPDDLKGFYLGALELLEKEQTISEKFLALTSYGAVSLYKQGIKFGELKEIDTTKLKELTSRTALAAYQEGITFTELKDLDVKKISSFTSSRALQVAYRAGIKLKEFFAELKDCDADTIYAFVSLNVPILVDEAGIKCIELIKMLKKFDSAKINALLQLGSIVVSKFKIDFKEFLEIPDAAKIRALSSLGVQVVADITRMKFTELFAKLKDLDANKIEALTSDEASKVYRFGIDFKEFLEIPDTNKIKALTSYEALKAYKAGVNFEELKALDVKKIWILTSQEVVEAYKAGVKFAELRDDYFDKIDVLISSGVRMLSGEIKIKYTELLKALSKYDDEKIQALTSSEALEAYKAGISFEELLKIPDAAKIRALTSSDTQEIANTNGMKFTELFAKLKDLDVKRIEALTSFGILHAYRAGIKLTDMQAFSTEEIGALDSALRKAYRAKIKIEDLIKGLIDLDAYKINALSSLRAQEAYKTGIKIKDLQVYDTEKIEALTSCNAVALYKSVKFAEVAGLPSEKLKALAYFIPIGQPNCKFSLADLKKLDTDVVSMVNSYVLKNYPPPQDAMSHPLYSEEGKNMFEHLVSPLAIKLYEAKVTVEELGDLVKTEKGNIDEKISLLASPEALALYSSGTGRFADLKNLSLSDIREYLARETMEIKSNTLEQKETPPEAGFKIH